MTDAPDRTTDDTGSTDPAIGGIGATGGSRLAPRFASLESAALVPAAVERVHVLVSGTVQGVWFRESTRQQAEALGVLGWVRNLPDGRVEGVFEGPAAAVAALVEWCRTGPPAAKVDRVEARPEPPTGEFQAFAVLRGAR